VWQELGWGAKVLEPSKASLGKDPLNWRFSKRKVTAIVIVAIKKFLIKGFLWKKRITKLGARMRKPA
jgi:hypothetical protein